MFLKWLLIITVLSFNPSIGPESLTHFDSPKPPGNIPGFSATIVKGVSNGIVTGQRRGTTSSMSTTKDRKNPSGCYAVPISPNTPTGIAGCERWGRGIASHYAPGYGVAMNFCTWTLRHRSGCGSVTIRALDTGLTYVAPVIDFCDCYTGTERERIIDFQWGVLQQLGLSPADGLYRVEVWPAN